jgi:16S rRNA (adenine1518-N6/adenine1519-N6)-dimethyltransferase
MPGRAKKRFGQHFLETAWVERVLRVIDPKPDQDFVEIGPGRGALTRPLAARARSVVAFEIDRDLIDDLRASSATNVTIIEADFLDPPSIPRGRGPIRVAANLPYNVASPILFSLVRLYDAGVPFLDATVMLQREVADRLLAEPGSTDYGVLTVLVRHSATVTRELELPPGAFRPPPNVRSSVVRLVFHPPDPPPRDRSAFTALVQAVFTRRRKTIRNALDAYEPARGRALPGWLDGRRRPETLSIPEFVRLADELAN